MSEVYLGEAPSYVKDWCKRNTYLTIEALDDGIFINIFKGRLGSMSKTFEVQLNDNEWKTLNWSNLNTNDNLISAAYGKNVMTKGDKLRFKNITQFNNNSRIGVNALRISSDESNSTATAIVYGNLLCSVTTDLVSSGQSVKFANMFCNSPRLVDASKLNLDNIDINTPRQYWRMFYNCPILSSAPSFSDITLSSYCYCEMFYGCSQLSDIMLPATTLAISCYNKMFDECSSLTAIHFPKSFQGNDEILSTAGSDAPWFGAISATIYYDL